MTSPYWNAVRDGRAEYWYRSSGAFITIFRHQGLPYRGLPTPHIGKDATEPGLVVREGVPGQSIGPFRTAGTKCSASPRFHRYFLPKESTMCQIHTGSGTITYETTRTAMNGEPFTMSQIAR